MINPEDPLEVQVAKQARIIEALVRRAGRQNDVSSSAYSAFQSAIALQGQIWAKTQDLERASNELQLVRFDRERTRQNLSEALSALEGGFALFADGKLQICNDLFKSLMPDITDRILPGLKVDDYFDLVRSSRSFVGDDRKTDGHLPDTAGAEVGTVVTSFVLELEADRWFQISQQQTSSGSVIILQTEITELVRKNRSEKNQLIDMQAHYLQAAFDHMSLGICTFSRDGAVMIHNDRFRSLLGLPFTLVQNETRFSQILSYIKGNYIVVVRDKQGIDGWVEKLRNEGQLRKRLRNSGGRVLELHANLLPDFGFLVDIKDVTLESRTTELLEKRVEERTLELTRANHRLTEQYQQQARVEEELRLAKEQAEAAVSSKTRFLAAASHDLLQPINAAKLLISTLRDMSQGTGMEAMVRRLDGSFTSVETLLHALLDISRLESTGTGLTPTEFCLGSIMRAVIEDQAPIAEQKGVKLDVVPSSVWVRSDQRYLMRSVQNLVVNAIQYTEKGRVLVGCRRRGKTAILEVWDTGIGISHKDQARVFEEFARAENVPPGSGMGLGLSIVDRTCRHMGHKVGVRSKPGVGSVFSIEMDTVPERPLQILQDIRLRHDAGGDLDLIALVVENDPDVLFATLQKLERWGASVLGARSTSEALQMLRDIDTAPDIILADYQLDGSDTGIEAIRRVRRHTGVQVPAIMVTADRSMSLVRAGREDDFTVVPKPVELARLRSLINSKTQGAAAPSGRNADKSIV